MKCRVSSLTLNEEPKCARLGIQHFGTFFNAGVFGVKVCTSRRKRVQIYHLSGFTVLAPQLVGRLFILPNPKALRPPFVSQVTVNAGRDQLREGVCAIGCDQIVIGSHKHYVVEGKLRPSRRVSFQNNMLSAPPNPQGFGSASTNALKNVPCLYALKPPCVDRDCLDHLRFDAEVRLFQEVAKAVVVDEINGNGAAAGGFPQRLACSSLVVSFV